MELPKILTVPLQYQKLIMPAIFIPVSAAVLKTFFDASMAMSFALVFAVIFFVYILLISCFAVTEYLTEYTIGPEGITLRYFGIRIRQIPWEQVGHAIYAFAWRDDLYPYYSRFRYMPHMGQIIYVTLKGNVGFRPEYDVRWFHRITHLLSSFCIFLPATDVSLYTKTFEQYYPKLKRETDECAKMLGAHKYDHFEQRW